MSDVSPAELKKAVESQHGGTATLAQSVPVRESFDGKPVWEGVVHVFDLADNPKATRAYAWSAPIGGSAKRRFFAVLQMGGIKSPVDAVRAAIVAEHRAKEQSFAKGYVDGWRSILGKDATPSMIPPSIPSVGEKDYESGYEQGRAVAGGK